MPHASPPHPVTGGKAPIHVDARSPQAKRPRTRGPIVAASQVAMTFGVLAEGTYELGGRLEREETFIGGIHEAVNTNA